MTSNSSPSSVNISLNPSPPKSSRQSPQNRNTTAPPSHSPSPEQSAQARQATTTSSAFRFPFRPRGQSTSVLKSSPSSPKQPPLPHVSSDLSLPQPDSPIFSTIRNRSRSPNSKDKDLLNFKGAGEQGGLLLSARTPLHGSPSTWWERTEIVPRPWKETPRRKKTVPQEQTEAWLHTRSRVSQAAVSVLGTAGDVAHELLYVSVDALRFAPVIGLAEAARTLLSIWDALQLVDMNRLQCLRLTERCADILISVREEIADAGEDVGEELQNPVTKLTEAYAQVLAFLQKQIHRPFIKRYLRRDEILQQIADCDSYLRESLDLFGLSIQIRILKQVQKAEIQRQADAQALISIIAGSTTHHGGSLLLGREGLPSVASPSAMHPEGELPAYTSSPEYLPPLTSIPLTITPIGSPTFPATAPPPPATPATTTTPLPAPPSLPNIPIPTSLPTTQAGVRSNLRALHTLQNELDMAHDTADLRQLMRMALLASDDKDMIEVLQVGRDEMPEAIKTLQRALEKEVVAAGSADGKKTGVAGAPSGVGLGITTQAQAQVPGSAAADGRDEVGRLERSGTVASRESVGSGSGSSGGKDTLDREFIESGIDVLRRMSQVTEVSLPSWTITRYEVDREEKIGIGFFSDVYRGTWRRRTVAIKVLAPTTPSSVFRREVEIWKTLRHVNVLELYGASSATGDPPWFFVSPYLKNGSLVKYLKSLSNGNELLSVGKKRNGSSVRIGGGNGKEVEDVDVLKMMHEVARGMEYLHSMGVLHGDLKGSNVLVDDKLRCVIADFGQSEMKSEAYRLSGSPLSPHGTLRWQSPELMAGQSQLTTEVDVYAYAICCIEILTMGSLPWAHMNDDAVRHFVLKDNTRPPIPKTRVSSTGLSELLRVCWHRDPFKRPPFSKIVRDVKTLRVRAGGSGASVDLDDVAAVSPMFARLDSETTVRESPDMRPVPLPLSPPTEGPGGGSSPTHSTPIGISPDSSNESYRTAVLDEIWSGSPTSHEPYVPEGHVQLHTAQPVYFTPSLNPSRASSIFTTAHGDSDEGTGVYEHSGYDSPPPANERIAEGRNERRYRMLLSHDFHPSLTLPLWSPSPVSIGAVGYLSRPGGSFVTLFDAFDPINSSKGVVDMMPSLHGYGSVTRGSHRQGGRNMAQKGLEFISGLLTLRKNDGPISKSISRRQSFPLRAGHRTAYLYTESTTYEYFESLDTPKQWFKANVARILELYGAKHSIQKEDLYLVIGTLRAQDYALFISHQHPDGQGHFNVFSSPKEGQAWGMFTTDTEFPSELGGPSYHEEVPGRNDRLSASKVSCIGQPLRTILIAKLRFKPDVLDPTSL